MSDYMPKEIVEQILLRLPIKPLLRCTSICKPWYNLITSTDFIHAHLDSTKSLPNRTHLFIFYQKEEEQNGTWLYDNKYVLYSDHKAGKFVEYARIPIKVSTNFLSLVGCCNGLICLANRNNDMEKKEVVLWNPVIRRAMHLPESDYHVESNVYPRTFGFVFDHIRNDYKVLKIYTSDEVPTMVEVFRSISGLWEDISYKAPFRSIFHGAPQVDLKGIAHWIGRDNNDKGKIITFDVHEEVFGSIKLPFDGDDGDDASDWYDWDTYLFSFDESLFLIRCVDTSSNKWEFDSWRMGDYNVVDSWYRVHSWVFDEEVHPLCFKENGEILWIVEMEEEVLISTNLIDASVNYLGIGENATYVSSCLYAESLILLDRSLSCEVDDQKIEMLQER